MSKQRILIATLFISLIANAFFIGFAATRMLETSDGAKKGGILHGVGNRLTRNLDDPARQQISEALEALNPQYQQARQDRHENYQELRQLLAAAEPDRETIETVLVKMRQQSSDLVFSVHEEAVEAILKLPAGQRAGIPDASE